TQLQPTDHFQKRSIRSVTPGSCRNSPQRMGGQKSSAGLTSFCKDSDDEVAGSGADSSAPPRTQHAIHRDGRDAFSSDGEELPSREPAQGALHGALRQAGRFGDIEERELNRRRPAAVRLAPEEQVDEKRRRP